MTSLAFLYWTDPNKEFTILKRLGKKRKIQGQTIEIIAGDPYKLGFKIAKLSKEKITRLSNANPALLVTTQGEAKLKFNHDRHVNISGPNIILLPRFSLSELTPIDGLDPLSAFYVFSGNFSSKQLRTDKEPSIFTLANLTFGDFNIFNLENFSVNVVKVNKNESIQFGRRSNPTALITAHGHLNCIGHGTTSSGGVSLIKQGDTDIYFKSDSLQDAIGVLITANA